MNQKDGSIKVVLTAVVVNFFVTISKSIGWMFSLSPSMLAEAIHSFADTANQFLIYLGIRISKKGPTREFPSGYGQARYLWNLISASGIFFIGFGVTAVCYEEFSFSLILLFNFYGLRYTSVGILSSACFTFISIRAVSKIGSLISKVMRCVSKGNVPFGNRYCSPLILKSCLSTFFSLSSF